MLASVGCSKFSGQLMLTSILLFLFNFNNNSLKVAMRRMVKVLEYLVLGRYYSNK